MAEGSDKNEIPKLLPMTRTSGSNREVGLMAEPQSHGLSVDMHHLYLDIKTGKHSCRQRWRDRKMDK